MKVSELITVLQKIESDVPVMIWDDEGHGLISATSVELTNENIDRETLANIWYGPMDIPFIDSRRGE